MSGITLTRVASATIPTPTAGKDTVFDDSTIGPAYKSDAGLVTSLRGGIGVTGPPGFQGEEGEEGPAGATGAPGATGPSGGSAQLASIVAASAAIAATETVVVSASLAAGYLTVGQSVGKSFRIRAAGVGTTGATPGSDIFRIRIGPTTLTGTIPTTVTVLGIANVTAQPFDFEAIITLRTNGAGGTIIGECAVQADNVTTGRYAVLNSMSTTVAAVAVDTTVTNLLELTYISGNAGSSNTFHVAEIEVLASGAAGGGGSALTVEEPDASPTVSGVTKIVFPEGTVSVNGTVATVRDAPKAFIGAQARASAATVVVTATFTMLAWAATDAFDSDGFHNPASNDTRMTIPAGLGGKYMITVTTNWDSNATGERILGYRKNGSGDIYGQRDTSAGNMVQTFSAVLDLVAGDYIEAGVYQTSGANRNANAVQGAYDTFSITKLDSGKVGAGIGARAYHSTTQSFTNGAEAAFSTADTELFDSDGFHSLVTNTGRMTVPAGLGGKYLIGAYVNFAGNATGYRGVKLRLNGATTVVLDRVPALVDAGSSSAAVVETVYDLVAGDYVECLGYQDSGGNLNGTLSGFWVMRLDSGSVSTQTRHGCLVYHNTTQTVNGTFILFNSEVHDSDAYHSTSSNTERITIPAGLGGLYLLEFGTNVTSIAVGEFCRISINGGVNISLNEGDTNSGYVSGQCVYPLVAGDYVTVVFTGNRTLGHASAYEAQSHFSATLLAT